MPLATQFHCVPTNNCATQMFLRLMHILCNPRGLTRPSYIVSSAAPVPPSSSRCFLPISLHSLRPPPPDKIYIPRGRSSVSRLSTTRWIIMTSRVLVLVGGGHAHIQVILNLAPSLTSSHTCIVISDVTHAAYSGMLPAVIAGLTPERNAYTPLAPLAKANNFHFIHARVTSISNETNSLTYRPHNSRNTHTLSYDFLSINIGSRTLPLPIHNHSPAVISTRPIGALLPALRRFEALAPPVPRVVVVGAGAAGVELVLAIEARLRRRHSKMSITLVSRVPISEGFGRAAGNVVSAELRRRGVVEVHSVASYVDGHQLELKDGRRLQFDCLVLATGAAPHSWMKEKTDLKTEGGWLHVGDKLNVVGTSNVFAAGDCITFGSRYGENFPPKAGVYAVREGPILTSNLSTRLEGKDELKLFSPQVSYLSLLSTGDGRGIGSKYGVVFKGTWVYRWKNFIDETWQQKFRVGGGDSEILRGETFEGSAAEGAAILQAGEEVVVGDSFEKQLLVLQRMDADSQFRKLVAERCRKDD